MKKKSLHDIGWGRRDHKEALWWLALIYRDPKEFENHIKSLEINKLWKILVAGKLYLHFLPYLIFTTVILRFLLYYFLSIQTDPLLIENLLIWHIEKIAFGIARGIAFGIAGGIALGIAGGIVRGIVVVIAFGIAVEIAFGITGGITEGIAEGIAIGIAIGIAVGIAYGIALGVALGITRGIAGGIVVGIAVGWAVGIAFGITVGVAFLFSNWRAYYFLLHPFYYLLQKKDFAFSSHPVRWDKLCVLPFWGFDRILVAHAETNEHDVTREIERILDSYPTQRPVALRAKTILLARKMAACSSLHSLPALLDALPSGDKGYLAQIKLIRQDVSTIVHLQAQADEVSRPFLKQPRLYSLVLEIKTFKNKIAGYKEPLVTEFRKAAQAWLDLAQTQLNRANGVVKKAPTPQVFRAGDPVNPEQEAYIPRLEIIGEVEQQVMLAAGCPGLVLSGRRRVGKTTIIRNMRQYLPPHVKPASLSMQNPKAFTSASYFYQSILREMKKTNMVVIEKCDDIVNLTLFYQALEVINSQLEPNQARLLMAIDEYENIDRKIAEGVFPLDLLPTLREAIQNLRRITWIFSGSHDIEELPHADWTSHLISARTIIVPEFTFEEVRTLLTAPMAHSSLYKTTGQQAPGFEPLFWGEEGIEAIYNQTMGWPVLVQQIAETLVDLVNNSVEKNVTPVIFERGLDKAVERGHNVFFELVRKECVHPGEWEYLSAFRRKEGQPIPADESVYTSLRRRRLVVEENGEMRMRVPLMRRWLRLRG